MPTGTFLILVLWGFIGFVAWYFYWHLKTRNRAGFRVFIFLISSLFFFALIFNWVKNRPPESPKRLIIFPFINQTISNPNMTWESLAFAEISAKYLESPGQLLVYPLQWLTQAVHLDSLVDPEYIMNFSQRIRLDYFGLGSFINKGDEYEVHFKLLSAETNQVLIDEDGRVFKGEISNFAQQMSNRVIEKASGNTNTAAPNKNWFANDQVEQYFTSRLCFLEKKFDCAYAKLQNIVGNDCKSTMCLNFSAELDLSLALPQEAPAKMDHFGKAKIALEASNFIDPDNSETHRLMAELYMLNKRWARVEKSVKKSIELNAWNSNAYQLLAQLHPARYQELGFKNDKEVLERAVYINPCDFQGRLRLANIYLRDNRSDRTFELLKSNLQINENHIETLFALANYYMAQNDLLNSLATYKKILSLVPDDAEAYYNLGIVYYHQKNFKQATEYFAHAIKLTNHADSHLYLAYIYEKNGNIDDAVHHLRQRIALRKGQEDSFADEARMHLSKILSDGKANSTIKRTSIQD